MKTCIGIYIEVCLSVLMHISHCGTIKRVNIVGAKLDIKIYIYPFVQNLGKVKHLFQILRLARYLENDSFPTYVCS